MIGSGRYAPHKREVRPACVRGAGGADLVGVRDGAAADLGGVLLRPRNGSARQRTPVDAAGRG